MVVPSPPVEGGAASQAGVNKPAARENWRPPSPPQPYWKTPPVFRDGPAVARPTQAQQSSSSSNSYNSSRSSSGSSSGGSSNDRCSGESSRDPRLHRSSSKNEGSRTASSRDPRLNRCSSRDKEGPTSASRSYDSNSNSNPRDHGRGETKYESSRTDVRRGGKGAKEDRVRGLEDILVGIEEREKIREEKGRGEGRGGGGGEARWLGDEGASNRDRRAQDDGYRSFRDDGRVGGGRGDGDVYRRHARCDDRGSGGGGRGSDDRARNGSRNENERRGEGYGGPRRVGKSCPPPSAEKKGQHQTARDGGNAVSSPEEGEDDELAAVSFFVSFRKRWNCIPSWRSFSAALSPPSFPCLFSFFFPILISSCSVSFLNSFVPLLFNAPAWTRW